MSMVGILLGSNRPYHGVDNNGLKIEFLILNFPYWISRKTKQRGTPGQAANTRWIVRYDDARYDDTMYEEA